MPFHISLRSDDAPPVSDSHSGFLLRFTLEGGRLLFVRFGDDTMKVLKESIGQIHADVVCAHLITNKAHWGWPGEPAGETT